MLQVFTPEQYTFEFKGKQFKTFNVDYIPFLLGKTGNQTAINAAGSTWKRYIHRNLTYKQAESDIENSKWLDLFELLNRCIQKNFKKEFRNFSYFQKINIINLKKFKSNFQFRSQVLSIIYDENYELLENVPVQYIYILFVLYISQKYHILRKFEYRLFSNKLCQGSEEYKTKFFNGLNSNLIFENLTGFCYTQYFWMDFRLSDSSNSIIHQIIFDIIMSLEESP